MNTKKKLFYFSNLFLALAFSSCQETCNCRKDLGCTIVFAIGNSDTLLKERKSYCSDLNYYKSQSLADSANAFSLRHASDDTSVGRKDSIYYSQTTKNIKSKDTKHYENLGYSCDCFK